MIFLDTDHLSVLQHRDSPQATALRVRMSAVPPDDLATTAVSLEEQTRGWLAKIALHKDVRDQVRYYSRLVGLCEFYSKWNIQPFDDHAADEFLRLRHSGVGIGTMDLKIAAICLVEGATLLSANLKDFEQVPGLHVEDWLSP